MGKRSERGRYDWNRRWESKSRGARRCPVEKEDEPQRQRINRSVSAGAISRVGTDATRWRQYPVLPRLTHSSSATSHDYPIFSTSYDSLTLSTCSIVHLDPIMKPRSIAVIGASRSPNTIGHQILGNLVKHGFTGAVYPVNPSASSVHSIRAFPDVASLPEQVDMAVIVVPKQQVLKVATECGANGVKGIVVISAGFREVGGEGVRLEAELMEVVRRYGMRMIGPNCMGVLNGDPAVSMNATFAPSMPPYGGAAFVSQSGAIGASILDYAAGFGIGISQFVSIGNKPDVSSNDLLIQWENDPTVRLILMYVESFGNPRNFLKIARRITRHKPIVVVKSGRSSVGARAASSHTGALAASDASVDALFAQAGVLRAESIEEMFDIAIAFSDRSLPTSRNVAVLTNAGGPGIIAADSLEAHGLNVVDLQPQTVRILRPLFPPEASLRNPLDMIASANPAGYSVALDALLRDSGIASVVAIFVPPLGVRQEDIAEAIGRQAVAHPEKPVLAVLMGREGLPQGRAELHRAGVPAYIFPESAARALASLCRFNEGRNRPDVDYPAFDVDRQTAATIIDAARRQGRNRLTESESLQLLRSYGIPTADFAFAANIDDAVGAAASIGYPVVMKIVAPDISHKSDIGGVRVGIQDEEDARGAFNEIINAAARAGSKPSGVLVQRMEKGGIEIIVGFARDPSFGPMLMFGLGGIFVEVLRDVAFRIAPIDAHDARKMVKEIRGAPVLQGLRGNPAADIDAIVDTLLRLSQLAVDLPDILELDINPLLARADGVVAVDGRAGLKDER